MRRFYETAPRAKKALKEELKKARPKIPQGAEVYFMGKHRPKRKFYIGTHLEWLNLDL